MRHDIDLDYQLRDNIQRESGRIFLTGTQALLRMLLSQARRDRAQGLHTAGFVTGYRGSPLGGVDATLWRHEKELEQANIRFQPAINEDLAATMLMGTQQLDTHQEKNVDGVFGMWFGKGPGLDRSIDAILHGHGAGASFKGGVLLVVGDDHVGVSSSLPHRSEHALRHLRTPIVHPSSVDEYEYFGLWGWALSRYSGAWVAFKAITETVESGRAFAVNEIPNFEVPGGPSKFARSYDPKTFITPQIELNIESRLQAVREFARANPLDRIVTEAPTATLGVISSGKSTLDTSEALAWLAEQGVQLPAIRHYKIGLIWPLEEQGLLDFAQGLEHILVIEEKGDFIESQVKSILYGHAQRPTILGKLDAERQPLLPSAGQLSPTKVKSALLRWLAQQTGEQYHLPVSTERLPKVKPLDSFGLTRRPYFCSGCPHSTSTKVPEGSKALSGVGCHYMAAWMDRDTQGITQMGGEGTDWIGASAFMDNAHIFQNMGEGTYFHSGYLSIRQAVAAQANITFKILFNDAVAMTGGQPVDGPISVPRICQQVIGEGVTKVVVTTDEPERYRGVSLPAGIKVYHRRELDYLQRQLRDTKGVTVLIHDQTCAAEKRRRRRSDTYPDPARRIYIHPEVCEGCGDCGVQSNCLSIVPLETELGRKRAIDQSSCNKDYSCAEGFCPSFVSVLGAEPKKAAGLDTATLRNKLEQALEQVAAPEVAPANCNLLVAGIGGTGVVTIGAIVAMAAHLEHRASSVLDITGLAQKGGTVVSHVRLAADQQLFGPVRIDKQQADVAIWCDSVAAIHPDAADGVRPGHTQVFINQYLAPTSEFTAQPDVHMPRQALVEQLAERTGEQRSQTLDAHGLAEQLLGNSILSNMLLLGAAWQAGAIPLSLAAIRQAIKLNGVAVEANQLAFDVGRVWVSNAKVLEQLLQPAGTAKTNGQRPTTVEQALQLYRPRLTDYQDAAYADQFVRCIQDLQQAEQRLYPGREELTVQAAHSLFKLMAYKDEYEVARLYSAPQFMADLKQQFEAGFSLNLHLAPPFISKIGSDGRPQKRKVGPWVLRVMPWLAKGKRLRGTVFDVFGYQAERRLERALRDEFMAHLRQLSKQLDADNYDLCLQYVQLPQKIRGFGPVKHAAIERFRAEQNTIGEKGLAFS